MGQSFWPYVYNCLRDKEGNAPESCAWQLPYYPSKEEFFVGSSVALGPVVLIQMNALWYMIYALEHPMIEKYKCLKEPWPWQQDQAAWRAFVKKTFAALTFNNIVMSSIFLTLVVVYYDWDIPWRMSPDDMDGAFTIMKQFVICTLCEDVVFHFGHRLFHVKHKYLPLY